MMKFSGPLLFALLVSMFCGCVKINEHLNRALEEEKSYTRHAMETYRRDPRIFQEDKRVLEDWSRSDYVARAVAKRNIPGNWAKNADELDFLETKIQHDAEGKAFCVIQQNSTIFVLTMVFKPLNCKAELVTPIDTTTVQSGDMEFSGRSDYWIYLLRPATHQN